VTHGTAVRAASAALKIAKRTRITTTKFLEKKMDRVINRPSLSGFRRHLLATRASAEARDKNKKRRVNYEAESTKLKTLIALEMLDNYINKTKGTDDESKTA
jgi:hypothetical protein